MRCCRIWINTSQGHSNPEKYTGLNPAPAWIMARKGQTGPSMRKHTGTLKMHLFCLFLSVTYMHTHTDHTPFTSHRISRKLDIFPQIVCCSPHKKTHTSLAVTLMMLMPQDKAGPAILNKYEPVTEGQPYGDVNCTVTRPTACQALRPVNISISLICLRTLSLCLWEVTKLCAFL